MSAAVRFIHAADLHLDAPFGGIDATDARVKDALAASTYRALDAIVDACLEHGVDFLVVAGDLYNTKERAVVSQLAVARAAARLGDAGIRVFIVNGNHDPTVGRTVDIALPENVHVFSPHEVQRVVVERDGEALCAVYGRSFRVSAETENLARQYRRDAADTVAIGVLHTNVGGRPGYDDYAPCAPADLRAAKMDYWALGHIHKPEIVLSDPLSVYAGCPQGLDPTQSGERGCWLVDVTEGLPSAQFIPLAPVVWDEAVVPCDELATVDDVRAALLTAADAARERADGVPVVLRIDLQGDTPAHDSLAVAGALEALVDDVRAEALSVEPWVWLDRVRDRTRPQLDLQALRRHEDFAGDVVRLADELLARPANAQALLDEVLAPLLARLGAGDAPDLDALDVVARARDRLLDRLRGEASR